MRLVEESDPAFGELWATLLNSYANPTAAISESHFEFRTAYLGERLASRFRAVVEHDNRPICGTCFDLIEANQRTLDALSVPSAIIVAKNVEYRVRKSAEAILVKRIALLPHELGADRLTVLDQLIDGGLSALSVWALSEGASTKPAFTQIIDLTQDEDSLRKDMTKGCRWDVNWGLKHLAVDVSHEGQALDELRRLHTIAAGGSTRSDETWAIQRRMVENDEAFMVTAALDGAVVSASLFQLSADDCCYGVSAADRSLFEKRPLGHATMWEAIRYAKKRGRLRFATGSQVWEAASSKELNISKFKRSFGGKTVTEIALDLALSGTELITHVS